jgi:hypothetical protein
MTSHHVEALDGDPGRIAVVLPGSGYTAEHPLLEYPSRALEDAGWSLRTVVWDGRPQSRAEGLAVYEQVVRDVVGGAADARCLVVGKSLGTLVLPLCVELGVPGAWITPLLAEMAEAPPVRAAALALAGSGLPALLAGSPGDPSWDADVAARSGARVVEVAGADHRLVVAGDWRASLAGLGQVTSAVEELAALAGGA